MFVFRVTLFDVCCPSVPMFGMMLHVCFLAVVVDAFVTFTFAGELCYLCLFTFGVCGCRLLMLFVHVCVCRM